SGNVRHPLTAPDAELRIRAELDLAGLSRRVGMVWPLAGTAVVEADVRGRVDSPEVSGRLTVPRLAAGAIQAQEIAVRGHWRDGSLELPEITAHIFEGRLRGSLRTRPDTLGETRVSLTLHRSSIAAFRSVGPVPDGLQGEVDLEADVQGDPRRPEHVRGRFRLAAVRLVLPGRLGRIGAGTLSVEGTLRHAAADLARATGQWPGLQAEASGRLGREGPLGLRFTLEADLGRLGPLWNAPTVIGRAAISGQATGGWDSPQIVGEARAAPLQVASLALDSLRVPYRLDATRVTVQSAAAALGRSRAQISGTVAWSDTGGGAGSGSGVRFQAEVLAPNLFWEDLEPWLPSAARGAGRFGVAGRVEGTPEAWRAEGTAEAPELTAREMPIRDLHATVVATPERIDVPSLRARIHAIPVAGTGAVGPDGSGRFTADVGPTDLSALPGVPDTLGFRGAGRARIQAAIRAGTVEASARVALEQVAIADMALGNGAGRLELRDRRVQGGLAFPDARLAATVQGPIEGDLTMRAEARDLAVAPLLARIEQLRDAKVEGALTASAEVVASLAHLAAARGTLTVSAARLRVAGDEWTNRGPVALRWEPARLRIESLHVTSRLGDLRASGRIDPRGPLEIRVDGRFPLHLLPALRPEIREAGGALVVRGEIGGTVADPLPTGEAAIQGGMLQLRDRPETLRDLEARMLISPGGLRLVEATASLGRGRIRASGDLALSGWRPEGYRILATGTNIAVAPLDGLQTAWDVDLELVGRGTQRLLRGECRLLQGRYTGRWNLVEMLLRPQTGPAGDAGPAIPIQIALRLNNNLRIDTNWARMQVGGRLSLEGTTARPVVLGSLTSETGRITFRKHRWTVSSAAVRFADPRRIDPILDVTGRALINQVDVTLRLSGRLDELLFRVSSVPPLSQQELLSLVTVGSTSATAGGALGEIAQLL
ncbi:MAG: translocation/assembly module TamB, partial [Planctomycetes bacterium]|nr:translocation/assembly module TamB [Planctomycetota bacterium]